MRVYEALAKALADNGLPPVFGLVGDANLFFVDSYASKYGGRYVRAANESNAVLMALGYASVTGTCAVATVTHGPALTNTATALVEGVKSGTPIVLIAGDTPVVARDHLQNVDQRALVESTGAGFELARSPETVLEDLAQAFRRANAERRPIVLDVPADQQWAEIDYLAPVLAFAAPAAGPPAADDLDDALGLILSARAPLVLAGRGAAAARDALLGLARAIGAPVATTLASRDLFRDDEHDIGVFGLSSSAGALLAIQACDCIIAFGAGLNQFTTDKGGLLAGKRLVQIDSDARQLGRYVRADVMLLGDAAATASAMAELIADAGIEPAQFHVTARRLVDETPDPRNDATPKVDGSSGLDVATVVQALEEVIPRDRTLVSDAGRYLYRTYRTLRVDGARRAVQGASFGSIGLGVGLAIGAAVGSADRPTLLVVGDGGFLLGGINDLYSIVRERLDVIVAVMDDGAYGEEHIQFVRRDMDPGISYNSAPDFTAVAAAFGLESYRFASEDDLAVLSGVVANRMGPMLLHFVIDPLRRTHEDD